MKLPGVFFSRVEFGSPEYHAMAALRIDVLRRPLGLEQQHPDPSIERRCVHFAAFLEGHVLGTLVLEPVDPTTLKMRQVATRDGFRRMGIASGLVRVAEEYARATGHVRLIAHARESAIEFYQALGYEIGKTSFLEVTIPHRHIAKNL